MSTHSLYGRYRQSGVSCAPRINGLVSRIDHDHCQRRVTHCPCTRPRLIGPLRSSFRGTLRHMPFSVHLRRRYLRTTWLFACLVMCDLAVVGCAAASGRPAQCTGTHLMRGANGQCVPCGATGQPCCPDEDPNTGPPFADYCTDPGTDCLATDPPSPFGDRTCVVCGHDGERACTSGCVSGFPASRGDAGAQYCSCVVPAGMDALPGCPGGGTSTTP